MKKFLLILLSGLLLTTCAFAETPFLDKVITYTVKTGTITTLEGKSEIVITTDTRITKTLNAAIVTMSSLTVSGNLTVSGSVNSPSGYFLNIQNSSTTITEVFRSSMTTLESQYKLTLASFTQITTDIRNSTIPVVGLIQVATSPIVGLIQVSTTPITALIQGSTSPIVILIQGSTTPIAALVISTSQWTRSADNTNIWNNNTSNVGIGTTAPTAKLNVIGNIKTLGEINSTGTVTLNDGFSVLDSTPYLSTITETFRPTGVYQEALTKPSATIYWNDAANLVDADTNTYTWIDAGVGSDIIATNFNINIDTNAIIVSVKLKTIGWSGVGSFDRAQYRDSNYVLKYINEYVIVLGTSSYSNDFSVMPTVFDLNSSTFSILSVSMDDFMEAINDLYLEVTYTITPSSVFARGYVTIISSYGDTRIQVEGDILPYYNCEAERLKCNIGNATKYWNSVHYHTAVTHSFEDKVTENDAINTMRGIKLDQKSTFGPAFVAKKKKPIKVKQGKKIVTQEITDEDSKEGTDVNTVIEMLIKTNQYLLKEIEKKKDK